MSAKAENSVTDERPLFERVLGESWIDLDPVVRRFHDVTRAIRMVGVFRVQRGKSCLAQMLCWLTSLPAAGDAVDVHLVVKRRGDGEDWARQFEGRPLESYLSRLANGLLAERMGPWEIRFRLNIECGALLYHPAGARFCLGPIRIPVPRLCAPRVVASERLNRKNLGVDSSVEVHLPGIGLLTAYNGTIHAAEESG